MNIAGDRAGEVKGVTRIKVVSALLFLVAAGFAMFLATRNPYQNSPSAAVLGEPVPAVAGVSYDGTIFDIDKVLVANRRLPPDEQEWVVINFFASWCVPCEIENPELIRFDEEGAACPTRLVGVTISDEEEAVAEFFEQRGGGWPVLVGDTNRIIIDFGVTAPPETVVVAPSGLVVEKMIGAVTYDRLVGAIRC